MEKKLIPLVLFIIFQISVGAFCSAKKDAEGKTNSLEDEQSAKANPDSDKTGKQAKTEALRQLQKDQEIYDKLQTECFENCPKCHVAVMCDPGLDTLKCACLCTGCAPLEEKTENENVAEDQTELGPIFIRYCSFYQERCYKKYARKSKYIRFICDDRNGQWKTSCVAEASDEKKESKSQSNRKK